MYDTYTYDTALLENKDSKKKKRNKNKNDNLNFEKQIYVGKSRCNYKYTFADAIVSPYCVSFDNTGKYIYAGHKKYIVQFVTARPGKPINLFNCR